MSNQTELSMQYDVPLVEVLNLIKVVLPTLIWDEPDITMSKTAYGWRVVFQPPTQGKPVKSHNFLYDV